MTIVAKYKDLRVHEWATGYEVEHIPTGATRWMSDGVDVYTDGTEEDRSIPPGTAAWNKACQRDLEMLYYGWLECYFEDLSIDREEA